MDQDLSTVENDGRQDTAATAPQKHPCPRLFGLLAEEQGIEICETENVTSWPGLFLAVDRRHRIFESTDVVQRPLMSFQLSARRAITSRRQAGEPPAPLPTGPDVEAVIRRFEAALHTTEDDLQATAQTARARATIERQVLHLTHLVDDLLDVSRISQGKILLRKEWLLGEGD